MSTALGWMAFALYLGERWALARGRYVASILLAFGGEAGFVGAGLLEGRAWLVATGVAYGVMNVYALRRHLR